jgi:hypothetical protein
MVCGWTLLLRNFVKFARWQDGSHREAYVEAPKVGALDAVFHLRGIMVVLFAVFFWALKNPTQERFC